jgi:hypothetical protein
MLGIGVGILCIEKPAEAQNYPWCAIYSEGAAGGAQIAASQHLNNAWIPRAGLAAFAIGTRNTCLHPDRIHRR